jgi:hypothetical protein
MDLKKAQKLLLKLQEFDNELVDLLLTDDGKSKIIGRGTKISNLRRTDFEYLNLTRNSLKTAQMGIINIIDDIKTEI